MIRGLIQFTAARFMAGVLLCFAASVPARAQQADDASRAGEQARLQAEKAKKLKPLEGNRIEQALVRFGNFGLLGDVPRGFYPWFGSILGGGSISLGGGYQAHFADTGQFNAMAGWSYRNYKLLQSNLILPTFAEGRVRAALNAKWIDAPRVSFYGIGNDSSKDDKTSYLYRPGRLGGSIGMNLTDWLAVGGGGDYLDVQTSQGRRGTSIEVKFTPDTAPGLGQRVKYSVGRVFAEIDWRQAPGYTRRGGLYRIEWSNYAQTGNGPYSFKQVDIDLRQFIPLLRENWVLAFRGAASMTGTSSKELVPYFMMPYLGSGETLRAFGNRRFRDLNSLLLQAEYRWTPAHFIDMAIFCDAGKVAARRDALDFKGLHKDVGIGIRLHGPKFTAIRLDVAKSKEGIGIIFSAGMF
jgi:hypothetical protein